MTIALMRAHRSAIAGLAASLALACAGCGGTTDSTTSTTATRPADTPTVSATSTTTSTTTVTTTTTVSLPGTGRPAIAIGEKNYTEQFVLGQLYLQALQAQGFVVTTSQIGPPAVALQALKTGALTMYPEYLNVFDTSVAGVHHGFGSSASAYRAGLRYAIDHGLDLLAPTPFSDTYGLAVTVGYAQTNRLGSIIDLRRVAPTMTIGGATQFQHDAPGLPTLALAYGVTPAQFRPLPIGTQYSSLDAGTIQAAYVNTTDGQLATGDYRLLTDARHIFGWGNVVPVVSAHALLVDGPALAATIERVDAVLTTPVMRLLNSAVDVAKQQPAAVARQFLQTHGLLTPVPSP